MDLTTQDGRRELGTRIQAAIAQAGYDSLPAFAERLGCSRALIYQYVNGDVLAQLDRLQEIARLTDRSLEAFFAPDPNGRSADVERLLERCAEQEGDIQRLERTLMGERGARIELEERCRRAQLETLLELAASCRAAGMAEELEDAALRALELARALADDTSLMRACLHAGHANCELRRFDRAREHLATAVELAVELGDERAHQSAAQELIRVNTAQGRLDEAAEMARELAASDRWWSRWSGRLSLSGLAEQAGDLAQAAVWLEEAQAVIDESDAPAEYVPLARAYLQSNRANLSLAAGRYEDAVREGEALLDLAAVASLPDQLREAVLNLAIAHMRLGALDEAAEHLQRLREWADMSGDSRLQLLGSVFEGERLTRAGNLAEAKRVCLSALTDAQESGTGHTIAEAELALAEVYLAEGLLDDAAYQFERCGRRAERLSLRRLVLAARLGLAETGVRRGDEQAAADLKLVAEDAGSLGYEDLRERGTQTGEDARV